MTTTAEAIQGRIPSLISPTRSTAMSDAGRLVAELSERTRMHLLASYAVRGAAETTLDQLEEVRREASGEGWNGYGARPMHPEAYRHARLFLEALPPSAPAPEVSADPDGDVALDWVFGRRKALSLSIGPRGRVTFAWMRGQRTFRGTDWLDDGIPTAIALALWTLASDPSAAIQRSV
jgi:hypothetical protein